MLAPDLPPVLLRAMTGADLRCVRAIERAAYGATSPLTAFEQELRNDFACYLVAVLPAVAGPFARLWWRLSRAPGDRIVGFLGVWYTVGQLHVVTVAVAPECQHRGIAQHLLLECFELARAAELHTIELEVRPSNARALRLYELFGFRRTAIRRGYYVDNGEDAFVMSTPDLADPALRDRLDRLAAAYYERDGRARAGG